jgi:hypothetical protein
MDVETDIETPPTTRAGHLAQRRTRTVNNLLHHLSELARQGARTPSFEAMGHLIDAQKDLARICCERLEHEGAISWEHQLSGKRLVVTGVGPLGWQLNGRVKRADVSTTRACMACARPFLSLHKHNRLCAACKS